MFNRTSKMTALLVAAAAVTSLVPATAAEKLGTKDGTIKNAVAFDGTYLYDGYRTEDDDSGLYFNNGKDKRVDEDEDYSYGLAKYGSKYVLVQDNGDYLLDLSNGKILDDESVEDKQDNTERKLASTLKKTDRYGKDDLESIKLDRIESGSFEDVWYKYSAKPTMDGDVKQEELVDGKLIGFTNESGKYIDVSQTANMSIYSDNKKSTVKINEYNKSVDYTIKNPNTHSEEKYEVIAQLENVNAIAQDSDYIYAVVNVKITENRIKDDLSREQINADKENHWFIQKISKAQGDKKDGAYLPKSVTSYELDINGTFNDSDVNTAANLLLTQQENSNQYTVSKNIVQAIKGNLYVTVVKDNNVEVYNLKLKKTKLDTVKDEKGNYVKSIDTSVVISDSDDDQDIVNGAVSIDAEGNTWALDKGKIYKFDGSKFKEMYTCDRSLDSLDVYNEKNLIAWDSNGDVFATTIKQADDKEEPVAPVVKAGWVTNQDGSWSYNKIDGTKMTGWLLDGSNWYYLNTNGIMQTGWVNDNGTWYYLNPVSNGFKGAMQTGWLNDNGTWYYLQSSGAMKTGWLLDGSNWYYLNANGSMAVNTTVDGYKVGANGAWIR